MNEKTRTALSKFLALVLRHQPELIGIALDRNGWAGVDELVEKCRAHGREITRETLVEVVVTSPKRRFALSDDGLRVRANQGHSIEIELGYEPAQPPELLFHGTSISSLHSIRLHGLKRMRRHHVHLSPDAETATAVGIRHGKPVALRIAAGTMHRDGHSFYLSANGVWLTEHVSPEYIEFPET